MLCSSASGVNTVRFRIGPTSLRPPALNRGTVYPIPADTSLYAQITTVVGEETGCDRERAYLSCAKKMAWQRERKFEHASVSYVRFLVKNPRWILE